MKLEFMFMKHYAPNRCELSTEFRCVWGGQGGQGRCDPRSKVFVNIQKKKWGGGDRVGGGGGGGQGGCERNVGGRG